MKLLPSLAIIHPVAAGALWATTPADGSDLMRQAYAIGNGKLGVMPFGNAGSEKLNLNIDDLWTGGPFEIEGYNGGNPNASMVDTLNDVREFIWKNGTGNDSALYGDITGYGSFTVAGNLSVVVGGPNSTASSFNRSLDLSTGIHTTSYRKQGADFTSTVYCSYPAQVCVYNIASSSALPQLSVSLENRVTSNPSGIVRSCASDHARLRGVTRNADPVGMTWDLIARSNVKGTCNNATGTLTIPASNHTSVTVVVGGGTDYDATKGTAADAYSFRGVDPGPAVENATAAAIALDESRLREAHIADYRSLGDAFALDLPDTQGSAARELPDLLRRYNSSAPAGDPYLEKLMFDYGRHLLISSSRAGGLPANLQGVWAGEAAPAWSADYHANINLQMNYWGAEQTGLGAALTPALWDLMAATWMPRGRETAALLYGGEGWVAHNELNPFGSTGMKDWPTSSDYAVAPAWMMQHVWDRFEYGGDAAWWRARGWPLLRGVARFWLSQLRPDAYSRDGSLVATPCTSPEQGPPSFACAHWQQLIHQVLASTLAGAGAAGEADAEFLGNVSTALAALDKGLHLGPWGNVKEWKVPESVIGADYEGNQHRHLSHLVGWFPGFAIAALADGYVNATIQRAVATSLASRGDGAADANAGWAKAWRAACWARLNETRRAHHELRFTLDANFAGNGLSMYTGADGAAAPPQPPFQIDANFGVVGAALSMLVVDLPRLGADRRQVVLGPAIPAAWAGGRVRGMRLRGGGSVDFSWSDEGVVDRVNATGLAEGVRLVRRYPEYSDECDRAPTNSR